MASIPASNYTITYATTTDSSAAGISEPVYYYNPWTQNPLFPQEQQRAMEAYQRIVNDYYNRFLDAYQNAIRYGSGIVQSNWIKKAESAPIEPENFDEEKLLIEEDF